MNKLAWIISTSKKMFKKKKIHRFVLESGLYSFIKLFVTITKHPIYSTFNLFLRCKLSKKKKIKLSSEKVIKLLFFYLKYSLSNAKFLFVTKPLTDFKNIEIFIQILVFYICPFLFILKKTGAKCILNYII